MVLNVAVVGAGVVGLSTAVALQQRVKNVKVTLIADRFDEGTTSWGAGGLFRPDLDSYPAEHQSSFRQWISDSWKFYNALASSEHSQDCGLTFVAGTLLQNSPKDLGYSCISELTHDFQKLDEAQIKKMNLPSTFKYAYSCTTVITHVPTYLRWLMQKFRGNGGKVECRKVSRLSQLSDDFDLVINCCGLSAVELCQDKSMYPVMGHLVRVKAPWFKKFVFSDDLYIIPHNDYVLLGGIKDAGNWSRAPDPAKRNIILSRAYAMFPALKHAPILDEWVGLRPGREKVRLEVELIKGGNKKTIPVIHNYGHGGHGISLSWGCALHATRLVQELTSGLQARL
ncbi:D-aspartate oxidase-like [Elysia marginata]|uniref:D-aspartate oxidase-like n=1 Tax=Elysia marginata TaxID=1093978 RepID=A0AAV4FA23_9GAST|nr:D-aspartate oxidase-like [Elysia marginata]